MFVTDGQTTDQQRHQASGRVVVVRAALLAVHGDRAVQPQRRRRRSAPLSKKKQGRFSARLASMMSGDFQFLEELDDMPGRFIDNADFFSVSDPVADQRRAALRPDDERVPGVAEARASTRVCCLRERASALSKGAQCRARRRGSPNVLLSAHCDSGHCLDVSGLLLDVDRQGPLATPTSSSTTRRAPPTARSPGARRASAARLAAIPAEIDRIAITVSADEAAFREVAGLRIVVSSQGADLLRFDVPARRRRDRRAARGALPARRWLEVPGGRAGLGQWPCRARHRLRHHGRRRPGAGSARLPPGGPEQPARSTWRRRSPRRRRSC